MVLVEFDVGMVLDPDDEPDVEVDPPSVVALKVFFSQSIGSKPSIESMMVLVTILVK